jgi:hypothetical protein
MKPELDQGKVEGRLECPKCNSNVGKYAWQGMQCSCGQWIVPGLSIARSRVDESIMKSLPAPEGIENSQTPRAVVPHMSNFALKETRRPSDERADTRSTKKEGHL